MTTLSTVPYLINLLRTAHRHGAAEDTPEGTRWIQISDTMAVQLADELEALPEPQVDAGDLDALTSAVQDLVDLLNEQHKREANFQRAMIAAGALR